MTWKKMRVITILATFFAIFRERSFESVDVAFPCSYENVTACAPYFTEIMDDDVFLLNGQTIYEMMCHVDGKPAPNVTWTKNGEDLQVTEATHTLRHVRSTDAGNYTCQACNELGCKHHTIQLHVEHEKPLLKKYLENSTAIIGKPFAFECFSNKHSSATLVYWYPRIANSIIPNKNDPLVYELRSSTVYSEIYKINKVTEDDKGWYSCHVYFDDQVAYSSAYLEVVSMDHFCAR